MSNLAVIVLIVKNRKKGEKQYEMEFRFLTKTGSFGIRPNSCNCEISPCIDRSSTRDNEKFKRHIPKVMTIRFGCRTIQQK